MKTLLSSLTNEPSVGSIIFGTFKTMIKEPSFIDDEEIKELLKIIIKNKLYKSILLKLLKDDSDTRMAKIRIIPKEEIVSEEIVSEEVHKPRMTLSRSHILETDESQLNFTKVKPKKTNSHIVREVEPVQYNRYETKIDPFIMDEQDKFFNSIFKELFDNNESKRQSKYDEIYYRTQHDLTQNNIWLQVKKDLSGNKDLVTRQGLRPFSRVTCIEKRMVIFNNILYEKCEDYMITHFGEIRKRAVLHASVYNEGDGHYTISFKTYGR